MKPTFLRLLALSAPVLALPGITAAAFNPALVSADARWVVHVDLIALRESQLGQSLMTSLQQVAPFLEQGGLRPDFEKIIATAGTLTAYGSNFSHNPQDLDGTLVLAGTPELRKIAEGFIAQATITEPEKVVQIKDLPFEAYALNGQATIAFPKEQVILFSKSQAQLVKAYDVLRGSSASLAKKSNSTLSELLPKSGSYFLIAASEIPNLEGMVPEGSSHSRILKMATAGAIAIGEDKAMTGARLQLVASSDDMADRLDRILQGMTAILSLTSTNDQQLGDFLRSVTTERKGQHVSLSLSYPSERLVQMMRDAQQHATMRHDTGSSDRGGSARAEPAPADQIGRVIGAWHADGDKHDVGPSPETMATQVFNDVALKNGATIAISGRRGGGEHARIDFVEIASPAGGAPAMRYEAEFMRRENYDVEKFGFVSGGELVRLGDEDTGKVSFPYQGADGVFRVTVGFVDESDGESAFALGVQDSVAVEAP